MTTNINDNSGLSKFNEGIDKLGNESGRIADSLSGETEFAKDIMASFKKLGDEFSKMKNIVEDAKNSTKTFKSFLGDKLKNVGESLKSYGEFLEKSTFAKLSSGFKELKQGFGKLGETIAKSNVVSTFKSAFSAELDILSDIAGGIKGIWFQAKTVATKFLIPFTLGAFKFFKNIWSKFKDFGKKSSVTSETALNGDNTGGSFIPPTLMSTFEEPEEEKGFLKNFFEGFKSKMGSLKKIISGFGTKILSFFFTTLLRLPIFLALIKKNIIKGFKKIPKMIKSVMKGAKKLFSVFKNFGKIIGKLFVVFEFFKSIFIGISAGIDNYFNQGGSITESILVAVGGFVDSVMNGFLNFLDFLIKGVGQIIGKIGDALGFDTQTIEDTLANIDILGNIRKSFDFLMENGVGEFFMAIGEFFDKIKSIFTFSNLKKIATGDFSFFDEDEEEEKEPNERRQGNFKKRRDRNNNIKVVPNENRNQGQKLEDKNIKAEKEKMDKMKPKETANNVYTEGNKVNQSNTTYNRTNISKPEEITADQL